MLNGLLLCMFLSWVFSKGKNRDEIQDSSLSHHQGALSNHQGTFLKCDVFFAQSPNHCFFRTNSPEELAG